MSCKQPYASGIAQPIYRGKGLILCPVDHSKTIPWILQVELPRHKDEMDPMETDNAAANTANYMASLNFDGLSRAQKGVRDAAEREKIDTEFTSSIDEQQAELGKVLPNLKAVEQYEEAKVSSLPLFSSRTSCIIGSDVDDL